MVTRKSEDLELRINFNLDFKSNGYEITHLMDKRPIKRPPQSLDRENCENREKKEN